MLLLFSHSVVFDSLVTPWTVACQAPLAMGFPRQEYWSELPFPSPGYLPNLGIEPTSLPSLALAGGSLPLVPPGKPTDQHNPEFKNARVLMKGTVPNYTKSDTLSPCQCSLEVADTFKKDNAGDIEMRGMAKSVREFTA